MNFLNHLCYERNGWLSTGTLPTLNNKSACSYLLATALRDGPLENLSGGGGRGLAKYKKKNSRKGEFNEKKFLHAN